MATESRTYKGYLIRVCESSVRGPATSHKGRWIIQTYHSPGVLWSDQECPHFQTLAEARRYINVDIPAYEEATHEMRDLRQQGTDLHTHILH